MSSEYVKYSKQTIGQITEVMQHLGSDENALQEFLDDRVTYLQNYRIDHKPLNEDAISAFSYDANELNVQFALDRGKDNLIKNNNLDQKTITIEPTEVIARHADGTPFYVNKVFLCGSLTANGKQGRLQLDTWNEPLNPPATETPDDRSPVLTTTVYSMSIKIDSDLITAQADTVVIGPDLPVKAEYKGQNAEVLAGANDKDLELSGFVDVATQSLLLQLRDVTNVTKKKQAS